MPSFPYGRQVIFPIALSICATVFLEYAVYDCNFVEITNDNVQGVSVGFWQTSDELNGNIMFGYHRCVPWTEEQAGTFDRCWNYGRHGGVFAFVLGLLATLLLATTTCIKLSNGWEIKLAIMQFLAGGFSLLLLVAFGSEMCTEFECWPDIGAIMCIAASGFFLLCGWITMSMGGSVDIANTDEKTMDTTETGSFHGDSL